MKIKALKGFKDIKAEESYRWQFIEAEMRKTVKAFGFREVRTPVLEHTELFARGVGETTDIVQKEMYSFITKGDDAVTLKPEGTAGAVRQFIEHKSFSNPQPTRLYYLNCPVFRYEQPQTGRLREHHQFGVEIFGSSDAVSDSEVVMAAMSLFENLGIGELSLHINNIGCPKCRPKYNEALKEFFSSNIGDLCEDCSNRLEKNPLRILDCKNEKCRAIIENAPKVSDYVCQECEDHFSSLKGYLSEIGTDFVEDPRLVRGLDYYTKLVFEIVSTNIGAQGTVCGGGRYDNLVEQIGGPSVPGVGFGMGMERLLLVMENQGIEIPEPPQVELYFANYGEPAKKCAWKMACDLRKKGVSVAMDAMGRSMKAQFKYADKLGAPYVAVIGESELEKGELILRRMSDGEETEMKMDSFSDDFLQML